MIPMFPRVNVTMLEKEGVLHMNYGWAHFSETETEAQ